MSTHFFNKDGQGKIIGDEGNDAMAWDAKSQHFHLKTLTRIRFYCEAGKTTDQKECWVRHCYGGV
jgi:hypothetical protein